MNTIRTTLLLPAFLLYSMATAQSRALVFQSDFGLKDGAVAAMKGVAYGVDNNLAIFDVTHEIPAYNIWEAAYRLKQTASYWPSGTVFVSVVDPGVGSSRKSVVMKAKSGHYFVTPDNGTLTLVAEMLGVEAVREIDEARNRLKNSSQSYTFHGRDVYAYTGARLAAGIISFEEVGRDLNKEIVRIEYQKPSLADGKIYGTIDILDVQYGNVWSNIGSDLVQKADIAIGEQIRVVIMQGSEKKFDQEMLFGKTFSDVPEGKPVGYLNSLTYFSVGINQGSLAEKFKLGSGPDWKIVVEKRRK